MRVLGVGETCDLGALYLSLKAEGHEVRVAVSHPLAQGTLAGLIERAPDWRTQLGWVREAGSEGLILFESVSAGLGALQDQLRREGFQVIGGSAYGDRLENDRTYAQAVLAELGFPRGHVWSFPTAEAASAFVDGRPGRYVLKRSGAGHASSDTYVGELPDGRDVLAMLAAADPGGGPLVLMDFIDGVEMGVGAYFNGSEFIRPACLDWEHKRFFPGDVGELTGEMGTVVTYRGGERMFDQTLSRLAPLLRDSGYCGYINLNTIVNDDGIWPLEFTCRFGYPGFPILDSLHCSGWDQIFRSLIKRDGNPFPTRDGYSVGVVITVPPFPYSHGYDTLGKGRPICFTGELSEADRNAFHYGEVDMRDGQLVTAGMIGYIMVVTGVADSIKTARETAYNRVRKVVIPNSRYRNDIGVRLIEHDMAELRRLGVIS